MEDENKQTDNREDPFPTPPPLKLWTRRGEEDVAYQRQAQVTWWTLLGGIAVGALLTQFEALLVAVKNGQWYYLLYFLATCFVIITAWAQTAWGALILYWPIAVPTSVIIFFGGLSESLSALTITRPALWTASISIVLLSAVLMQVTFMKQQAWIAMPKAAIKRAIMGIWVYVILIFIALGVSVYLFIFPSRGAELTWGVIAVILSVFALYWQHLGMKEEKKRMHIA